MNDQVLLSVIIPAYNAEKTIRNTLQSILSSFEDRFSYEVIVVENGSIDDTSAVVSGFQDEHVKLFHSEKGISNARNYGIAQSQGKWICFVDADDEVTKEAGKILSYAMQNTKADLCLFGNIVQEEKRPVTDFFYTEEDKDKVLKKMLEKPTIFSLSYSKLLKKERINQYNIHFDSNLKIAEDSDFILQYTSICKRIDFYPEYIYHVIPDANSVTHTTSDMLDQIETSLSVTQQKLNLKDEKLKNAYMDYILSNFHVGMVNRVFCFNNKTDFSKCVEVLKEYASHTIFHDAIFAYTSKNPRNINALISSLLRHSHYRMVGHIYRIRAYQKKKQLKGKK